MDSRQRAGTVEEYSEMLYSEFTKEGSLKRTNWLQTEQLSRINFFTNIYIK